MLERENIDNFIADDLALRNRNWGQIEDGLAEKATVTELTNGLDARYTKDETDGLLAGKANKQQEDWITPTLLNGWTQLGTGDPVGIMKDDMGFVHLRGAITGGEYPSICFQLPPGYRAANNNTRVPGTGTGYSRFTITVSVQAAAGSGWISLDGITFRGEV